MGSDMGKRLTCDRCGQSIFLKYLGKGDADGGYTTYDRYEDIPDSWMYTTRMGYLCSDCADSFRTFVYQFMDGNVAWGWKPLWARTATGVEEGGN